jgi:hypothetical protein
MNRTRTAQAAQPTVGASRKSAATAIAGLVGIGVVLAGCSSAPGPSTPSSSAPTTTTTAHASKTTTTATPPPTSPSNTTSGPLKVPATGAYLGAWINPSRSGAETAQLPAFASAVGTTPAILALYTAWTKPAPIATMQRIVDQGSVPFVAWGCASTAAINAGQYDQLITTYANQLKAFGHPVLLRWFWEMNLSIPKDVNCLGSGGAAGFVSAWIHVWNIFHQVGATNVSFVWCPGVTGGVAKMAPFFPGAAYVDWIGADGYDRRAQGTQAFSDIFGPWYAAYAGYQKPMMIGETGAMANDQAGYLSGIESALPTQFPDVRALVYFDAVGPAGSWVLTGGGLLAYRQIAANPYFSVRPNV